MKRWIGISAAILATLAVGACSSDDDSGGGPCDKVCDCVASSGGDRADCMSQCTQLQQAGAGQSTCEQELDANGFPNCKSHCSAFGS